MRSATRQLISRAGMLQKDRDSFFSGIRSSCGFEEIYTEGITKITSADIRYAKAFGATIKLLASSKRIGDKYYAMVCPVMINGDSPLFSVNDVFNAIVIHGNMLGDADVLRKRRRKTADSQRGCS